jgi:hypothetical protein
MLAVILFGCTHDTAGQIVIGGADIEVVDRLNVVDLSCRMSRNSDTPDAVRKLVGWGTAWKDTRPR